MKRIATLAAVLVLFGSMASAQERIHVSTETQFVNFTETFSPNPSALFGGQQIEPTMQMLKAQVQIAPKVEAVLETSLYGKFNKLTGLDFYTHTPVGTVAQFPGHAHELNLEARVKLLPNFTVFGGYTRFGIYSQSSDDSQGAYQLDVRYSGIKMGLAGNYSYERLLFGGSAEWMPNISRTDDYLFSLKGEQYPSAPSSAASGYALKGTLGVRFYKTLTASVTGGFRDVESVFGNQLVRITQDEIPSTSRWRTVGFAITAGF
jgi:hypothetical protein